VLLIYNLAYPAIRGVLTIVSAMDIFCIAAVMWLGTMGFVFFEGRGYYSFRWEYGCKKPTLILTIQNGG